jgi:hypothetical protein
VGFSLDWPGECHDLGFCVSLLAADQSVTHQMADHLLYEPMPFLVEDAEWLLATRYLVPVFRQVVDVDTWKASWKRWGVHELYAEIVRGFVTGWNLVKPCQILAPFVFGAAVDPVSYRIAEVEALDDYIREISETTTPFGLHTFGKSPEAKYRRSTSEAIISIEKGLTPAEREKRIAALENAIERSGPRELDSFVAARAGKYIPSGTGNDPISNPDSLPTG